ncbi:MAG: saccharopine dehydrogenase NADP-binding domain-containing protein [Saprospiraceae bacterium]|nr:saccharopine dehydrogenase NADP-binding domain-containing protein [Saprospiraceae bacterium]
MKEHHRIIIAGAGGIAEAAGHILAEWSETAPDIYIGNRTLGKAQKVADWIITGSTRGCRVKAFHLSVEGTNREMESILEDGDILLDCLPGSLAPRLAQLAKQNNLHYVNLTEYVAETNQIKTLAADAKTGFILQSGLAPGYIDVLAHGLFRQFCKDFDVEMVDKLEMKVGALTDHAVAPHYYGFTWSPVGVATEYLENTIAIRDYQKVVLPSLSEKNRIIIDGIHYEDDLTSGGAADLPDALTGKVRSLDYKTLRHPGHYDWVQSQIHQIELKKDRIQSLQKKMEADIPHLEDDHIVIYAAVEGKGKDGILRRREIAKKIRPQKVGKYTLRAIQTTTAVPMLQSAQLLLEGPHQGVILQSQLDPLSFLNGDFITKVYCSY